MAKVKGSLDNSPVRQEIIVPLLQQGLGIFQLPCPELCHSGLQRWGQSRSQYAHPFFLQHCRQIADTIVSQFEEYLRCSIPLGPILGVEGSPSCGISFTYDTSYPNQILLSAKNLTHIFNSGSGIEDISLEITAGQILAVMGPNGAGKSTLIKHFIGLLKAQKGKVLVMGHDPSLTPVTQMAENIGILFQNPDDQIFNERIDKEVAWGLKAAKNYSWPQALAESQGILESFGLDSVKSLHPYSVSRSTRQLIALASVLVKETELIILDEPGKSLDAANTHSLMSFLLAQFSRSTQSIIIVTHDPYLAWSYADQIALIVEGHLMATGPATDLLSNPDYTQLAKLSKHPFIKKIQDI